MKTDRKIMRFEILLITFTLGLIIFLASLGITTFADTEDNLTALIIVDDEFKEVSVKIWHPYRDGQIRIITDDEDVYVVPYEHCLLIEE